jgi:hypothetical protein
LEPDPTGLPAGSALIVLERGPNAGSRFLLDQPVTSVGRHPRSDIFLDDVTELLGVTATNRGPIDITSPTSSPATRYTPDGRRRPRLQPVARRRCRTSTGDELANCRRVEADSMSERTRKLSPVPVSNWRLLLPGRIADAIRTTLVPLAGGVDWLE